MRHKSIRVLYMYTVYTLGLPFMVLGLIGMIIWSCVLFMRDEYMLDDLKDLWAAGLEGLRCGHATNMLWVKYGNSLYNSEGAGSN